MSDVLDAPAVRTVVSFWMLESGVARRWVSGLVVNRKAGREEFHYLNPVPIQ